MQENSLISEYTKKRRGRAIWKNILTVMICIVVFVTTYALILPAITQEKETFCGLEEHTHTEECNAAGEDELICELEEIAGHAHDDSCYLPAHTHSDTCYTEETMLTCGEEEAEAHAHGASCYAEEETLVCGQAETEAHTHGDACYSEEVTELTCGKEESAGHTHGDACYTEDGELSCEQEESAGHAHGASCYTTTGGNLICMQEESAGHAHGDRCYETAETLVCGQAETEGHTHEDTCYTVGEPTLTCGLEEREETELICELEEIEGHTHEETCYDPEALCELEEHEHELICYSDKEADVETAEVWERTLANVELSGVWADDLLAIAESQLGYQESTRNYIVTEDNETKGYTRYGDWYGDDYGDWCAMFVSFCLHYAEVDSERMPRHHNCAQWIEVLQQEKYDLYRTAEDYVPVPGDVIFFDWNGDGKSEHVGLVAEVIAATETEPAKVKTIEGNSSNQVKYNTYALDHATILGYGVLPENPELADTEQTLTAAIYTDGSYETVSEDETVITVTGVMPQDAEVRAYPVELETELEVVLAYDIEIILADGTVFEPDESLKVNIQNPELDPETDLQVYYVPDEGEPEEVTTEVTEEGVNFEAPHFSTYAVAALEVTDTVPVTAVNSYWHSDNAAGCGSVIVYSENGTTVAGAGMSEASFPWWYAIVVEKVDGYYKVTEVHNTGENESKSAVYASGNGFILLYHTSTLGISPKVAVGDYVVMSDSSFWKTKTTYISGTILGTVKFSTEVPAEMKQPKDNTEKLSIADSANTLDIIEVNLYDYNSSINTLYNTDKKYPGFQQDNGTSTLTSSSTLSSGSFNFGNNITSDLAAGISELTNKGGTINTTVDIGAGTANTPIEGAISKVLQGGYPALADGTSLDYLFKTSTYATQKNTANINGLFQYNSETGAYNFNSRENHAQFSASTNTFTLYDQIISSNFMMYPFGNFLPFNDITKLSAQASTIDGTYLTKIAASAAYKYQQGYGKEYQTLSEQLSLFVGLMDNEYGANQWDAYDATDAYFNVVTSLPSFSASHPGLLDKVYSIDYDEETDFFFGMDMKMTFMQPKNGLTGLTGQEPMEFYFTGDDDVWIYVDGVLFLDLSGIHRHVGGEIDFVNGKIYYYSLDVASGDVATTPYKTVTFEEAFRAAYAEGSAELTAALATLNDKGTFKDYSTHTFNFYYMERGAGSGVCRMNFNFPLLKQNSISVSKEVHATDVMNGNPDYKFQVLKANDDGTKTDTLFIAANTAYTIYDENNKQIDTGTTDANGVFTLKAGQRAEFTGIKENAGKYYVRELFESNFREQYGEVTVSGESTTTSNNITIGEDTFTGADSPVKDMSDGATAFRFTNNVDVNQYGSLEISKTLTEFGTAEGANKEFEIQVTLDGIPVPVGTAYTVGGASKTVTEAGIITIKNGETAVIPKILAGTAFTVQETSESAKGYTVVYAGGTVKTIDDREAVIGTIGVKTTVKIGITNAEKGASVTIPGTKSILNPDGREHTYNFSLNEVTDATGTTVKENGLKDYAATATVTDDKENFAFNINYVQAEMGTLPATFYYKITEDAADDTLANDTVYVAEVTVSEVDGGITAAVTGMWKDGIAIADSTDYSADFVNTLVGDLTLSKTVNGSATSQGFIFTVELGVGTSGLTELAAKYDATVYQQNGEIVETAYSVKDGKIVIEDFKHGERVVFHDIPIGTTWTITESNNEGYIVTYTVGTVSGSGSKSTGTITTGNTEVAYTNTQTYSLPETGGAGTNLYTTVGMALAISGIVGLMYRRTKRKWEVYDSP